MPDTPTGAGPPGDSQPIGASAGTSDEAVAAATGRPWAEWFELLDAVIRAVSESLGRAPASESRTANYVTARWKLGQGSLLATANPTKAGRTSVTLTHQRLPDAAAVGPAKAAMAAWLRAVSSGPARGLG